MCYRLKAFYVVPCFTDGFFYEQTTYMKTEFAVFTNFIKKWGPKAPKRVQKGPKGAEFHRSKTTSVTFP